MIRKVWFRDVDIQSSDVVEKVTLLPRRRQATCIHVAYSLHDHIAGNEMNRNGKLAFVWGSGLVVPPVG